MIDAGHLEVKDAVEGVPGAVVGMLAPGDVAEMADRQPEPEFGGAVERKQRVEPRLQQLAHRAKALLGGGQLAASLDQRVPALLGRRQLAVDMAFAQPVGREDDAVGLGQAQQTLEQHGGEGQRVDAPPRHALDGIERTPAEAADHPRQILGLAPVDPVLLDDVQRVVVLLHVDASQRPPRPADRVEGAAAQVGQPVDGGEMAIDQRAGLLAVALGGIHQADRTERQGDMAAGGALGEPHQLDAAAAEVAHQPVGLGNAGQHALRREPRLVLARQDAHRDMAAALDLGDEVAAVDGVADGRGCQQVQPRRAHGAGQAHEAGEVDQRRLDAGFVEPAGRVEAAPQAAQHLLVEQRQGRARRAVEHHQADRIGADVDDRDAAMTRQRREGGFNHAGRRHGDIRLILQEGLQAQPASGGPLGRA